MSKKSAGLVALAALAASVLGGCTTTHSSAPARTFSAQSPNALVLLFTRVARPMTMPEGRMTFTPYDPATGRLERSGENVPGHAFTIGRGNALLSNEVMHEWQGWAKEVEPGSYVLTTIENPNFVTSASAGLGPTYAFDATPGAAIYIGDLEQVLGYAERSYNMHVDVSWDPARARTYLSGATQTAVPMQEAMLRRVTIEAVEGGRRVVASAR